ncbi:MAG: hypothetical protein M3312_02630 [Actinomycetota bacterium]|nr:hypothetical protein [Actinomycetota bacterium]
METDVHRIDDHLSDEWLEAWLGDVIADVEAYLGKHAAFDAFLDGENEPV